MSKFRRFSYLCWICVSSASRHLWRGISRGRFVSRPKCGSRNAPRGHEDGGGGPGHPTGLSCPGLFVGQCRDTNQRLSMEKRLKCWYFLAWHIFPSPPPPAASSLEIWRGKKRKLFLFAGLFSTFSCLWPGLSLAVQ